MFKLVQLLLDAGADLKAKVNEGALIAAAGNPLVVEELLAAGADPGFKDKYGQTFESESCDRGEMGHYEVCQLVRDALCCSSSLQVNEGRISGPWKACF